VVVHILPPLGQAEKATVALLPVVRSVKAEAAMGTLSAHTSELKSRFSGKIHFMTDKDLHRVVIRSSRLRKNSLRERFGEELAAMRSR